MFFFLFRALNPVLIAAAAVPALFLMMKIYRADRLEPEPKNILVRLVGMGFLATAIAMALETAGGHIVAWIASSETMYNILFYFLVVALAEEWAKYFLLKRSTWNAPSFNCRFDGVVYAAFVSLGFALAENVGYVLQYGMGTALLRAVTAVPGHACFGIFMGAFYGAAKQYEHYNIEQSRTYRILALVVPTLLHGTYDYIATQDEGLSPLFILFVGLMFFAAYKVIKDLSRRDDYIRY